MNVALVDPAATFSQKGFPVANALGNDPATGWGVSPQQGKAHAAYFPFKAPLAFPKGTVLTVTLTQSFRDYSIGKFRLSVTTMKPPLQYLAPPEKLLSVLKIAHGQAHG